VPETTAQRAERLAVSLAAGAAEPEQLARRLDRILAAAAAAGVLLPDDEGLLALAPLVCCEAPASRLAARPRLVPWLTRIAAIDTEKSTRQYEHELRTRTRALAPGDTVGLDRVLRRYRQRELLRIALRDFSRRAPLRVVTREISALADALLGAALAFWDAATAARFGEALGSRACILAMGKLGGREVNYSSDVDVLFVYDRDERTPAGLERRDQMISVARGVIRSLSALTADGFAFRVDANLRPYGRDGPLASSADEMERYYERAGQTWERAALIKARPCAGGIDLGHQILERLRPFVWRRTLDLAAVDAIAAMKRRIDDARAGAAFDDVKLGRGGIREIEFFVQAHQLLHGGRKPALRSRNTLEALEALVYAGLLPAHDRDALADAYVLLRDVEHRLQLPQDRQTQRLPAADDRAGWDSLARRMGTTDAAGFRAHFGRRRSEVHSRFVALLANASGGRPAHPEAVRALSDESSSEVREAALASLGFTDPAVAREELRRLARLSEGVFGPRGRERHPELAERILEEMGRSPAPDDALSRFAALRPPLWDPGAVTSLLAEHPATARLLVLLFASSEGAARDFAQHPELLDVLVRSDAAHLHRSRDDIAAEVAARRAGLDHEARLELHRQVRHEEALRVGLHDLAGRLSPAEVGRELTHGAEALLDSALALAREQTVERYGEPPGARVAILGLGSFGGAELDSESDLDLVFVHDTTGRTSGGTRGAVEASEWAARLFQRLVSNLTLATASGVLYRVDSRLRPSGSQGALVTTLEALREYHLGAHARGAALWERQAFLRARPVAGDPGLAATIVREVLDPMSRLPLPADAGAQISQMRRRLDVPSTPLAIDPKRGPGGLLDVQFAVELLELRAGLREPSTGEALKRLGRFDLVDDDDLESLRTAWRVLRRVERRVRFTFGRADASLPRSGPMLRRVARLLGEAGDDGQRLVLEVTRTMSRTRRVFDRVTQD
jgi:glutamate-ammonia-ligase adenylyltransferase